LYRNHFAPWQIILLYPTLVAQIILGDYEVYVQSLLYPRYNRKFLILILIELYKESWFQWRFGRPWNRCKH